MRRLVVMLAALSVSACVAGPPPEIDLAPPAVPDSFVLAVDAGSTASLAALLPYGDPAFGDLAALTLADAPQLDTAIARIEAARAAAARQGAERLPRIGADAAITATRTNPAQFGADLPPGISFDTERVQYGTNLTFAFDPDLFGRIRAQERAALARLDARGFDAAAVRNTLLADLAAAVIDWRTLDARRQALAEDAEAASELARLAGVREEAGIAPGFDRVRAQALADASRSRAIALESERARLLGQLVTLTGQPAQRILPLLGQPEPLYAQPPAPAALPSVLLTNRPDVRAAAADLAAADADLTAIAAQRFPQFTLSAAIGLLSFDLASLFDDDALVGQVSGGLLAPLFDFGRIEAEIDQGAAQTRLALAQYRGAVFGALGEAEAAYGLVAAADRELAALQQERASAQRAAQIADARYRAGLSNFLTVLEARRSADASAEREAAARGRAARARVLLWRALGGEPVAPQAGDTPRTQRQTEPG